MCSNTFSFKLYSGSAAYSRNLAAVKFPPAISSKILTTLFKAFCNFSVGKLPKLTLVLSVIVSTTLSKSTVPAFLATLIKASTTLSICALVNEVPNALFKSSAFNTVFNTAS